MNPINDDATFGYTVGGAWDCMRAYMSRTKDGDCIECREAIPVGCTVYVYGDSLCGDCGSERKARG